MEFQTADKAALLPLHPRRKPGISGRNNAFHLWEIPAFALGDPPKFRSNLFVGAVNVSCALTRAVICTVHRTRPTRGVQSPSPRAPWLCAGNNAATRCLRSSSPLTGRQRRGKLVSSMRLAPTGPLLTAFKNAPGIFVRRGADFRGVLPLTLWPRSPQRYFLRDITSNNSRD